MDDNIGLLALSAINVLTIIMVFAALMWAAVQDGRDALQLSK